MDTTRTDPITVLTPTATRAGTREVVIERPVAVEVNGIGYAVMMMSPADLEDFATGFMLTERLADTAAEIHDIDAFERADGWILRVTIAQGQRIMDRVRHRTSDTGCGLCGVSGLEQISRRTPSASEVPAVSSAALFAATAALRAHQPLNRATGAVHGAAWCDLDGAVVQVREDVGRHNALDKLIGVLKRDGSDPATGFMLVTSRLSYEMVDKALVAGVGLLVGISAPTAMALDHARQHRLTLIALARSDAMLVMNDPYRQFTD